MPPATAPSPRRPTSPTSTPCRRWSIDHGPVDILVNNAGNAGADPSAITGKPFWQSDPTEWEPFIGVNLYGVFHCCRAVIPGMIERGGRRPSHHRHQRRRPRRRTRARGLLRGQGRRGRDSCGRLAKSLGRYDITANSVAIATTNTPAVQDGWSRTRSSRRRCLRNYTIRRFGEPSDVAAMVTFLASSHPRAGSPVRPIP